MKIKLKYIIIFLIFQLLIIGATFSLASGKEEVSTEKDNKLRTGSSVSMMLETSAGSGEYKQSDDTKWPTDGYVFNEELSKCDNGGMLSWNDETHSVILKTGMSDRCYVYFDVKAPDITIAINDLPISLNSKLGLITCNNSIATYNQRYNRIEISDLSKSHEQCILNYTNSTSKVNLATYITGLVGTTQGTGQVVNENGYRYEGKNPNNYVWFNNEYWRIIGVFDSSSHGQSANLVKIIRAELLDGLAWDKSNTNNWTAASLNSLLNENYYNATDGTRSGYCYGYSTTVTGNCDYTKKGIQSGYRGMIANVTWYLGTYSSSWGTAEEFYDYERENGTITGYIGLMYPSDYGYSVLSSSCARTTQFGYYPSLTCAGASWLYGKGNEWTLTLYTLYSTKHVFIVMAQGNLGDSSAYNGYGVRPVLYLDSTVYKIDGDGSLENPYIIGM